MFPITPDPIVPPVIHQTRRVPEARQEPLKKEIDSLEAQGIILTKVSKPTDWVKSLLHVTKPDGLLQLCLDPKVLNKAIMRPHHRTPTIDEILPKLNGAQYFSILDARGGYWNIRLDHQSYWHTTLNSPDGRCRFLRLPFGLICAQGIFQRKVAEVFGDLPAVTGIDDDIVISDKTRRKHNKNLNVVLERAQETGVQSTQTSARLSGQNYHSLVTPLVPLVSNRTPVKLKLSQTWIPLKISQTCKPSLGWFSILAGTFQI